MCIHVPTCGHYAHLRRSPKSAEFPNSMRMLKRSKLLLTVETGQLQAEVDRNEKRTVNNMRNSSQSEAKEHKPVSVCALKNCDIQNIKCNC